MALKDLGALGRGWLQIWEATLAPNETRVITLTPGQATAEEVAQVNALPKRPVATAAAPVAPTYTETDLTVLSPRDLQVFQRRTRTQGSILVSGRVRPAADKLEAKVSGAGLAGALPETWQAIPLLPPTRMFRAELPTPAGGWYTVSLRATKGGATVAESTIAKVGVGDVFVGAGQSNTTNYGQERTQQTSRMVRSFGGSSWQLADDPQPGTHDNSKGGSFWPAFGDAMYTQYRVPIGIATTGHGGTSVNAWQPGGDLHNWMMTRVHQLGPGGFRCVLWHQGESDVGMSPDEYAAKLTNTILASKQLAGWEFPWFVAQVSYHNPERRVFAPPARRRRAWSQRGRAGGSDTVTLSGGCATLWSGHPFHRAGAKPRGVVGGKVGTWLTRYWATDGERPNPRPPSRRIRRSGAAWRGWAARTASPAIVPVRVVARRRIVDPVRMIQPDGGGVRRLVGRRGRDLEGCAGEPVADRPVRQLLEREPHLRVGLLRREFEPDRLPLGRDVQPLEQPGAAERRMVLLDRRGQVRRRAGLDPGLPDVLHSGLETEAMLPEGEVPGRPEGVWDIEPERLFSGSSPVFPVTATVRLRVAVLAELPVRQT